MSLILNPFKLHRLFKPAHFKGTIVCGQLMECNISENLLLAIAGKTESASVRKSVPLGLKQR